MFDEQPDDDIYAREVNDEFIRVLNNSVPARLGYDTARKFGLDELGRLKAALIATANAHAKLIENRTSLRG